MRTACVTDFLPIFLDLVEEKRSSFERGCNYLIDTHLLLDEHASILPSVLASAAVLAVSLLSAALRGPFEREVLSRSWHPLAEVVDLDLGQVYYLKSVSLICPFSKCNLRFFLWSEGSTFRFSSPETPISLQ